MTPQSFVDKWQGMALKERSASQSPCRMLHSLLQSRAAHYVWLATAPAGKLIEVGKTAAAEVGG